LNVFKLVPDFEIWVIRINLERGRDDPFQIYPIYPDFILNFIKNYIIQYYSNSMNEVSANNNNIIILVISIIYYNSLRDRSALSRSALTSPSTSPWQRLLIRGDDSSFLVMTGFTRSSF
jgi:hypothetical protein